MSCSVFPNYEFMQKIPFKASGALRAYHRLAREKFATTPSMNAPNRDRTVGGLGEKVVTKP